MFEVARIHRVVSAIKFLTERGFAFRGSDENIGSPTMATILEFSN